MQLKHQNQIKTNALQTKGKSILIFLFILFISTMGIYANTDQSSAPLNSPDEYNFIFTGTQESFVIPETGLYTIEAWGAEGGNLGSTGKGGKGGFVSGEIQLNKNEELFITVGGKGDSFSRGFNGGGQKFNDLVFGGGASDIRVSGTGYFNRILVAGGGGASTLDFDGGFGGGLIAGKGIQSLSSNHVNYVGYPGLQDKPGINPGNYDKVSGLFGHGGHSYQTSGWPLSGGGGGGWFGGSGSLGQALNQNSAGGGSSYVLSQNSHKPNLYSPSLEYYFTNFKNIAGNERLVNESGLTSIGRSGDGFVRIKFFPELSRVDTKVNGIRINNELIPAFDKDKLEYNIYIDGEYSETDLIVVDKRHPQQVIEGDGLVEFKSGDFSRLIFVKSADGKQTTQYKLNFLREKSTKLKSIKFADYEFEEGAFNPDVFSYELNAFRQGDIPVSFETYSDTAQVSVEGLDTLIFGENTIKVRVKNGLSNESIYTFKIFRNLSLEYEFNGNVQEFIAPYTGKYKFDLWGAQGANFDQVSFGGKGGFTSGTVKLNKGELVYIYVGGDGNEMGKGFNGGGKSIQKNQYGGGASDIRITGTSPNNRVLVAGGGGAATSTLPGGYGGGLIAGKGLSQGANPSWAAGPGTQSGSSGYSPGKLAYGADSYMNLSHPHSAAGGGGFYGGGGSVSSNGNLYSGGGGSSYVLNGSSLKPEGMVPSTKYYASKTEILSGEQSMFDITGQRSVGQSGHGHVRVTHLSELEITNAKLEMIRFKGLNIEGFKSNVFNYTIELEGDYIGLDELSVEKIHDDQIVSQNIYHDFLYQDNQIIISVSSADKKNTQEYTINFVRKPSTKLFSLEVKNYLFVDEFIFDKDVFSYEIDTFRDDPIELDFISYDKNAIVVVEGLNDYTNGNNTVEVKVKSPGELETIYTIKVNRKQHLDFDFNGKIQHFYAPYTGKYKFEVWGAQGYVFPENTNGSYGGFVSGEVSLKQGELVYVYTGGHGDQNGKGFNGGGSNFQAGQFGGGASDIRIGGLDYTNRIMVAGGGGASTNKEYFGGRGGGLIAEKGQSAPASHTSYFGGPGTQSSSSGHQPGFFGRGSDSYKPSGYPLSAGGGGGWFGGGGSVSAVNNLNGGGGGSSYLFTKSSVKATGTNLSPNYYIENGVMPAFDESFFDVDGQRVEGRTGNGHIRVSYNSSKRLNSTDLDSIYYNGLLIDNFKPEVREYTIKINGEHRAVDELSVDRQHTKQVAVFNKDVNLKFHNHTEIVTVISADGSSTGEYLIHFVREDSTKLAELSVDEYKFSFTKPFKYDELNYDLSSYVYGEIKIHYNTFNQDATVTIVGDKEDLLRPGNNRVFVTVSHPNPDVQDTTYEINVYRMRDMEFSFSGKQEKFSIPYTGNYKFEAWGAQGYTDTLGGIGGKGGYSTGELFLRKGEIVYLNVGGMGDAVGKGYNGGGKNQSANKFGGGASDIRMGGIGLLYRSIVAGGGGSASGTLNGGAGGGLQGINGTGGTYPGFGGTQIGSKGYTNGIFGLGADSNPSTSWPLSAGGGGGWYGGGSSLSQASNLSTSGGGSSYLLTASSVREPNHAPSNKYFLSDAKTIPGNELMPGKEGHTVTGNESNGFIKVSLLDLFGVDSSLKYLNFSHGTSNKLFSPEILEYDLVLDPDQTTLNIIADTNDHNAFVGWDSAKLLTILPGVTRFELPVTAQDGSTQIYVVRVHRNASSSSFLDGLSVNGEALIDFENSKTEYLLNLSYDESRNINLDWIISRPNQVVKANKTYILENKKPIIINVISEDSSSQTEYKITPVIEDSNLLKSLTIDELDFDFDTEITDYDITVPSAISSLNITAIAFDHEAIVTILGNGYLRNGMNVVEVIVEEPNTATRKYTLNVLRSDSADGSYDKEHDFIYNNEVQFFEAPYTGNFKLEVWGAEGGNRGSALGGKGGYSKGISRLTKGEIVAIYVGGAGTQSQKGFNGGAVSGTPGVYGGGASDVRIGKHTLNERIIVAGGGGSVGAINKPGAAGGGELGNNNTYSYGSGGQGGTQSASGNRGAFGLGGTGLSQHGGRGGAGGGGWFGGGGANPDYGSDDDRGGGGGSAYVFTDNSFKPKDYLVDSKYKLNEAEMISGSSQVPNKDGGYILGNSGNGFVRITALRRASTDNHLERIELDGAAILEPSFDLNIKEYTVNLGVEQTELSIKGVAMDNRASVSGNGVFAIPHTGKVVPITVTSESGETLTYTVNVNRPSSNASLPKDIVITGLVPSLCSVSDLYCKLAPEFVPTFSVENGQGTYDMVVPGRIKSIEFNIIKGHEYQTVIGSGVYELLDSVNNRIDIEIESEDKTSYSSYVFNITRDMTGNADLDFLRVMEPIRDIEFNHDVTEYYISVPNEIEHKDMMNIEHSALDSFASVVVGGAQEFSLGSNQITYTVVAANGITKTYTIFVYRENNSNTLLERLVIKHGEEALLIAPSFNKTINEYILTVENEVDHVDITAIAEAPETTTIINGVNGKHDLKVGQNTIAITTTSEDGTSDIYTISIIRKPSNNANIRTLKLNDEIMTDFDASSLNQKFVIDSQITNPKLQIELENEFASYTLSGASNKFDKGSNIVNLRVTAQDGSTRNYVIDFEKEISTDSSLVSVESNLFDIKNLFVKDQLQYDINIPYSQEQLKIDARPSHLTSKVTGNGVYYLETGRNEVKILVSSEDGASTVYTLVINMLANKDARLKEIKTDAGVFDPVFNSDVTEYNINVPFETEVIVIEGTPMISSSVVNGLGQYLLNTGKNTIEVKSVTEGGQEITYYLHVTRDISKNIDLSYLVVHEGALSRSFDPQVGNYDVFVPNYTTKLIIEASTKNPLASYQVLNNDLLKTGNNSIIVRVTSQDGIGFKDYILNVYKQAPSSENIDLNDLKVNNGRLKPDFLPSRPFYRVSVGNEVNSMNLIASANKGVTISGNGNHDLKVGINIIVVKTRASNGVQKDYQVEVRRAPSTDARLKWIQVEGFNSEFRFNPDTYNYRQSTYRSQLGIKATTMNDNASYEIIGNSDFVSNTKTVVIVRVTAEDGITKKDYTFEMNKYPSNNNNLESLSVSGVNIIPDFNPALTTYKARVDASITQVNLSAKTEDKYAKIEMDKVHTLKVGSNFIDVIVTSESGKVRKYTVLIEKEGSKVNDLLSLGVDGVSVPNFDKDNLSYSYEYLYEKDSVFITHDLLDKQSSISGIGEVKLKVGLNTLPVVVTSENGETKTYNLNIKRLPINSAEIEMLNVDQYPLDNGFKSQINTYNLVIDNEFMKLNFDIKLKDDKATYKVIGNENLSLGINTITIEVNSSKKDVSKIYTFNVYKQEFANNKLAYLEVDKGKFKPLFGTATMVYNLDVSYEVDRITLSGESMVSSSIVSNLGVHPLEYGINHLKIPVKSNSGVTRMYHVFVNRSRSNDNYLNSLRIDANDKSYDFSPKFDPKTNEYTLTQDLNPGTEFVDLAVSSNASKIKGHQKQAIKVGKNALKIIVTSDSGLENTYTINVNRPPSTNNSAISIKPSSGGLAPNFIYTENIYKLNVDTATTTLEFAVSTEDKNAKVSGNELQIVEVGTHMRTIKITAENGTIKEYKIEVTKKDTNNVFLKNLRVDGFTLDKKFQEQTFVYNITVPNNKKTLFESEVLFELSDSNATVAVTGNLNLLTQGSINTYEVRVTAVDGHSSQTYRINILRESSKEALIKELTFSKGELNKSFNSFSDFYDLEFTSDSSIFNKGMISRLETSEEMAVVTYSHDGDIDLKEGQVTPFVISVTSEDGTKVKSYNFNITYKRSTDNKLSNIELNGGQFIPAFSPDIFEYDVNVHEDTRSIVLNAFARDPKAKILSIMGDKELVNFSNVIEVKVKSENETIQIYKLKVNRNLSNNVNLKNISLTDAQGHKLKPEFDNIHKQYEAIVPRDNTHTGLIVVKGHDSQKITLFDSFNNELDLNKFELKKIGRNYFKLEVRSPFDDLKLINITIVRDGNDNTNLKTLVITNPTLSEEHKLIFDKEKMEYFTEVSNIFSEIEVLAEAEESTSVVSVEKKDLSEGNNDVVVRVTAENGEYKNYIIHVFRAPRLNNYLQGITVSTNGSVISQDPKFFTPNFNRGLFNYSVEVPSTTTKVSVQGIASNTLTTKVVGSSSSESVDTEKGLEVTLKPGNNFVTLSSTDIDSGSVLIYTVNIVRKMSDDVSLKNIQVLENDVLLNFDEGAFDPLRSIYKTSVGADTDNVLVIVSPSNEKSRTVVEGNGNLLKGENIIKVKVTSEDRTKTKVYTVIVIKNMSRENNLSFLNITHENESITDLNLEESILSYRVPKEVNQVTIDGGSIDPLADINGLGIHSISHGNNQLSVSVKAQSGDTKIYIINVFREYDNALESLKVSQGLLDPVFSEETSSYTVWVPLSVDRINVEGIARNSPIAEVSGNGWYDLVAGSDNMIEISVKSATQLPSEANKITIKVIRTASPNTNIKTFDLDQGILSPEFKSNVFEYETYIKDTNHEIDLNIFLEDAKSSFEIIGIDNVKVDKADSSKVKISGINQDEVSFVIRVRAENGDTKDTVLKVFRQPASLFSNLLKSLEITPKNLVLSPRFEKNTFNYNVNVSPDVTFINIKAITESSDATITSGIGTFPVNGGRNVYEIVVTGKDGGTSVYKLIIRQVVSSDASLSGISFEEGHLSPIFNRAKKEYTLNVGASVNFLSPNIIPYAPETTWTVSGAGVTEDLVMGENIVLIDTVAANGIAKDKYTIRVNKTNQTSVYLKTLSSNVGSFDKPFNKFDGGPYRLEIGSNVNSLILSGVAEEPLSILSIDGIGIIDMGSVNNKTVEIKLNGKSGNVMSYFVEIVKSIDTEVSLTYLNVNPGTLSPEFNSSETLYNVKVGSDIERIEISAQAKGNADIFGQGVKTLNPGINRFEIAITTKLGTTGVYTVIVEREEIKSSKVLELSFKEAIIDSPKFSKDDTDYEVFVSNEVKSLNIDKIILEDHVNASYELVQEEFKVGPNNVSLIVSNAMTDELVTYKFNVTRYPMSSNFLRTLFTDQGPVSPSFDKNVIRYEIDVKSDVTQIEISGTPDDVNSTVKGLGTTNLQPGLNELSVTVTSSVGIPRTYIIKVNRLLDASNDLLTLDLVGGILSPKFGDSTFNEYTVNANPETGEIEFIGTHSPLAKVEGLGKLSIHKAKMSHEIIVTAENGEIKIYKFNVIKQLSTDVKVSDITSTTGQLEPAFVSTTKSYTMKVQDEITKLGFDIKASSKFAKVSGNEEKLLQYGENIFTIKIVSEDGKNEDIYTITVIRLKDIQSLQIEPNNLVMSVNDTQVIETIINPFDASNKDLVWSSDNELIVSVTQEGTIKAIKEGSAQITVSSKKNPLIKASLTVEVLNLKIESKVLEIVREFDEDSNLKPYVVGVNSEVNEETFKTLFENELSSLVIFDKNGIKKDVLDSFISSEDRIDLVVNGITYDSLMIVVRGDVDGDGIITASDFTLLRQYISGVKELSDYQKVSSDIDHDGIVTASDLTLMRQYISGIVTEINRKGN